MMEKYIHSDTLNKMEQSWLEWIWEIGWNGNEIKIEAGWGTDSQ